LSRRHDVGAAGAPRRILILFRVVRPRIHRHPKLAAPLAFAFAGCCLLLAGLARSQAPAQQNPAPAPASNAAPAPRPAFVVVLDPAHGGTDSGARGSTGAVEKDLTLAIARAARNQLQQQGFRVILTRDGDDNPSFDDRAAVANAQRSAILISIHVSSTGQVGTARAYSYLFSTNVAPPSETPADAPAQPASRLIAWAAAQQSYVVASHRLADLIQSELAQKFSGSPMASAAFPVRDLRSVAAPAVAVELSSVTVENPHTLDPMIATLAASVGRAVSDFRTVAEAGAR
jgi:N-acetylmuramoyl-L-alanine amidase